MRESTLNKCPVSSYDQVCQAFKKELGETPDKIFDEFDRVPIASASLAQVHVARSSDGQNVAVKVQHTHMTDTAAADHATLELIVNTLQWFFPLFDYRWLVDEIRESLPQELDFLKEAKNKVKCLHNFRKLSPHIAEYVYAPKVFWNLSTSKLLTMEFMDAVQLNDVKKKHIRGERKPQLILFDRGLYREFDFTTGVNYAALWKALIFAGANSIKEYSVKLGAGEDLYALFAGILTMRPWNRVVDSSIDHLVIHGNDSERLELQMYASQYFPEISELLRRLPRVILLMLKTNDCLRSVNNSLLQGSSLESFFIIGKVSSEAVVEAKKSQRKSFLSRIDIWLEEILLRARLLGMQIALWLLRFRRALPGLN